MKPHTTIRNILVHPKDKLEKEGTPNCVYEIPCKNCSHTYVGETKRQFGVRLNEHKKEADKAASNKFTRSQRKESQSEINKSAITDHVARNNHIIDWEGASILERESDRKDRWVRESIWIRKRGTKTMNRDEGIFNLSHVYDPLLNIHKSTSSQASTSGKNSRQLVGSSQH